MSTFGPMETHLASPALQFPAYRMQDGVWTILMKDAKVTIAGKDGSPEVINLDYLKCVVKDLSYKGLGHRKGKRGRAVE
jgi:hypothetical protein